MNTKEQPAILGLDAVYRYRDETGRVLFERPRWRMDAPPPRNKMITYRWRPEAWTKAGVKRWVSKKHPDADRYLYRLPELLRAKETAKDIWWTEGEKDADALAAVGEVATSHHGGAGKVSREQAEWFRGHTGWVILAYDLDDDDEFGGNAGAFDVMRRYDRLREVGIPHSRIMFVHAAEGKDIADHLAAGYTPDNVTALEDVSGLVQRARLTTGAGLGWAGYDFDAAEWAATFREFAEVPWPPVLVEAAA